jgi:hypothetical protein
MTSTYTDMFAGSVVATIGKQPVVAATTGAIALTGSQTIDGVVVSDHTNDSTGKQPDRVLVKNQANTTTNGIYVVNNSGAWYRAQDFSGPSGVVSGQIIIVNGGTTNVGLWTLTTADPISIDGVGGGAVSNLTFAAYLPTITGGTVATLAVTGNETVGGTLAVTGNETVGGTLAVTGNETVGGTLAVTGAATLSSGTVSGNLTVSGHTTFEGVTSTGATGTGKLVYDTSPTLTTASLGSSTATTQSPGDNSTKIATTAYVTAATTTSAPVSYDNFLPNVNWQIWSGVAYITKPLVTGTGPETAVSSTSFQTTNNGPLFLTANTQQLKVNDLVIISGNSYKWGYAGVGAITTATANRVTGVTANTNVQIGPSPLGGTSPGSSTATTITPIVPGTLAASATGQAADGWKKATTLNVWADDFTANAYPGADRTMGILKGSASAESLNWTVAPNKLALYAGRTVTFGVAVYQKSQAGAGTWNISISDSVTGSTYSANGTGSSLAGFQFLSVTAPINSTATTFGVAVNFNGANADVYYVALPTAIVGPSMTANNLRQMPNDLVRPVGHWNPPLLTPLAFTFPAVAFTGTGGLLYGWSSQDLEAMSLGLIRNSVSAVKCKIELTSTTAGALIFTGSRLDYSLIFGPQVATQVSGVVNVGQGWLPLADDGTITIFTGTSGWVLANATFDFGEVQLNQNSSAN